MFRRSSPYIITHLAVSNMCTFRASRYLGTHPWSPYTRMKTPLLTLNLFVSHVYHVKAVYCHPAYLTCMQSTS